jgi:acyl dehydratase
MRVVSGLGELAMLVGENLGHSEWLLIDQHRVDLFAEATGDHQWIHTDPERAAKGPFGKTIAHGYLTVSLIPTLVGQIWSLQGISMGINYGSNKVRFPATVPVGSSVRAAAEVLSVTPNDRGAQVSLRVTIECDAAAKPVCIAETVSVFVA